MRPCAAAVVGALSFALVTGCSGAGSKVPRSAAKPAAKALSAAELKKLIVADGEVPGYKVEAVQGGLAAKSTIRATDAACRPVAYAAVAQAPGDAAAQTSRSVTEKKKDPTDDATSMADLSDGKFEQAMKKSMDLDVTVVTLSSYDGDGAAKTLKSLSAAVKSCAGGFGVQQGGDKQRFTKITEEKAVTAGDASVAFAVQSRTGDDDGTMHVEVVRHGSTLVSYTTLNIGAMMADKAYAVPGPVVKAQSAKLK